MLLAERLGIFRVNLPLPFRLNHVNCYAIQGNEGWSIIDTGLDTEESRNGWRQFMATTHMDATSIRAIYLTHYHPDHYGLAGWLQEISGAPVYIGRQDRDAALLYWHGGQDTPRKVTELLIQHGMSHEMAGQLVASTDNLALNMTQPDMTIMKPGDIVPMGNYNYEVVWTPGHSDGHLCFYNRENGIFFSGDHLLPKITSNISYWPDAHPNPLGNFLQSLNTIRQLGCHLILPAHGTTFDNMAERVDQVKIHHQERLQQMLNLAAPGATAYEVCIQVFPPTLSTHEMRFAMSETLAHLLFLVDSGNLRVYMENGIYKFIL